jgi:hypothetical protein
LTRVSRCIKSGGDGKDFFMRQPAFQQGRRGGAAALFIVLSLCLANPAQSREIKTIDPSGQWQGLHGVLSLMLTGDALSFSYSAVFGATAHLCDGVGVAGLVADGEYHYVDEQGTVALVITGQGVKLRPVSGIASFCGANWPGDEFTRQGYKRVQPCTVSDPKAHFHVVMRTPPVRRQAYVLKGDRVDVVPTCFEGGDAWVMARFKGPRGTTVGLLKKDALICPE